MRQSYASCASTVGVASGDLANTELADADTFAQAAVGARGAVAGNAPAADRNAATKSDLNAILIVQSIPMLRSGIASITSRIAHIYELHSCIPRDVVQLPVINRIVHRKH